MTRRRKFLWFACSSVAVVAVVVAAFYGYWAYRGVPCYHALPAPYWERVVVRWHNAGLKNPVPGWARTLPAGLRDWLGLGAWPAVVMGDPAALPVVLALGRLDRDGAAVLWAQRALYRTPVNEVTLPGFRGALGHENESIRFLAACRLIEEGAEAEAAVSALAGLAWDSDSQELALNTLANFQEKSRGAVPVLKRLAREGRTRRTEVVAEQQGGVTTKWRQYDVREHALRVLKALDPDEAAALGRP